MISTANIACDMLSGTLQCDGATRYAIRREILTAFIPFGVFSLIRSQMGESSQDFTSSYTPLEAAPDGRTKASPAHLAGDDMYLSLGKAIFCDGALEPFPEVASRRYTEHSDC